MRSHPVGHLCLRTGNKGDFLLSVVKHTNTGLFYWKILPIAVDGRNQDSNDFILTRYNGIG